MQPGTEDTPPTEPHQKKVADHHRRKHQGQVNESVDDGLARELQAGQQPGHQHTQGQTAGHSPEGHPQAQLKGFDLDGRERPSLHQRTEKPYFSNMDLAAGDWSSAMKRSAAGDCLPATIATG